MVMVVVVTLTVDDYSEMTVAVDKVVVVTAVE